MGGKPGAVSPRQERRCGTPLETQAHLDRALKSRSSAFEASPTPPLHQQQNRIFPHPRSAFLRHPAGWRGMKHNSSNSFPEEGSKTRPQSSARSLGLKAEAHVDLSGNTVVLRALPEPVKVRGTLKSQITELGQDAYFRMLPSVTPRDRRNSEGETRVPNV